MSDSKFTLRDQHGAELFIMKDDFGVTISTQKHDARTPGAIVYLDPGQAYDLMVFLESDE